MTPAPGLPGGVPAAGPHSRLRPERVALLEAAAAGLGANASEAPAEPGGTALGGQAAAFGAREQDSLHLVLGPDKPARALRMRPSVHSKGVPDPEPPAPLKQLLRFRLE